jgi:hypothetical protein
MNIDRKSLLHSLKNRIKLLKENHGNEDVINELAYLIESIEYGYHDIKVWQ